MTTGKYKILKIYDPDYQEAFTRNDLPPNCPTSFESPTPPAGSADR